MLKHYQIKGTTARSIAESLERAIDRGRFPANEPLPTIRNLALELGVSPTTVSAAFSILRRHGRIVGNRRGGSVVIQAADIQSAAPHVVNDSSLRNLAVANPDPAFLPSFSTAFAHANLEPKLYTDIVDNSGLLEMMRDQFSADAVPAGHIGVASAAMEAIERALLVSLRPNDIVALEDPCYPPYLELARALDLRIVRVPIDEFGITPAGVEEALRLGARALIVVPRAQNPTGAAFDKKRATALSRIITKFPDVLVIEDDYVWGVSGTELATIVTRQLRFLHVRSFGKTFGPDLRVAVYAGDELLVSRLRARRRITSGWVSMALQDAATNLLRDSAARHQAFEAERAYVERRASVLAAAARHGLRAAPGISGFTIWVYVADEAAAVSAARSVGFAIDAGARYRATSPSAVRITTTTLNNSIEIDRLFSAIAGAETTWHGP